MKPGTPNGMQLDPAVKPILPASTSSLPFFMCSLTQGFRFGLLRSLIRKVGWPPTPLGTKGYFGSCVTGPGSRPGTDSKNGPLPFSPTHPTFPDEKSGGAVFGCATTCAIGAAAITPTEMLPASNILIADIVFSPPAVPSCANVTDQSNPPRPMPLGEQWYTLSITVRKAAISCPLSGG